MRVAVAGADEVVGRPLVETLRRAGHAVVALTRENGVDVGRGRGVDGALRGCDAVVDVTTTRARRARDAEAFFVAVTDALMDAGAGAGVRHHVVLSVVGLDRVEGPAAWAGKRAHEERALRGAVPATVVRATHLHGVAGEVMEATREGDGDERSARVPPLLVQPVAVTDVALVLAELAAGPPRGRAPDVAGPQTEDLVDMARRTLGARGEHLRIVPSWRGVPFGPEMAGEVLLPGRGARIGSTTFDDWLLDEWRTA